jgi:hypothetical protein
VSYVTFDHHMSNENSEIFDPRVSIRKPMLSLGEVATRLPRSLPRSPKSSMISPVRPDRFERTTFGFEARRESEWFLSS